MTSAESFRISTLDSKTRFSGLLAIVIIISNIVATVFCVYILLNLHDTLDIRSGKQLLDQIHADYAAFEEIESKTRISMATVRNLEASIDLKISERHILDTANKMYESERDYQLFFRLLKVNIYYLTSQIPGTYSWYEIYGPEIDKAIERSQSQQLQILQVRKYYQELI